MNLKVLKRELESKFQGHPVEIEIDRECMDYQVANVVGSVDTTYLEEKQLVEYEITVIDTTEKFSTLKVKQYELNTNDLSKLIETRIHS